MKLNRAKLKRKIVEVKKGITTSHVRIDVGGQVVTAAITNESVEDLKLAVGQTACPLRGRADCVGSGEARRRGHHLPRTRNAPSRRALTFVPSPSRLLGVQRGAPALANAPWFSTCRISIVD